MFRALTNFLFVLLFASATIFGQNVITVTDTDIPVGSHVTFSSDTTYILSGMVFVDSAAVLTIEPGTIIKAEDGQGNQASGLVVTRYAKIYAEGTADRPIIFTSVNDELNGNLTHEDRGLWGGVILLGQASTNNQTANGLKAVEGVNEIVSAGDTRPYYGGTNDTHSSGVFKYVSIRYSGINVGDQAGNEIQGLTLGGVGSGTVIEYVESYASADDGFEWFGGTVEAKYLVSAFAADDGFDYDEGFRGKGQFWFAIQAPDQGGRIMEMDGATGDEFYSPYAIPTLANMTLIGAGIGATPEGDGEQALIWRDNAGCKFYNNVITDYDDASTGLALTIEDVDNTGSKTEDSRKRLEAGDLVLMNNLFYGFGAGNTINEMSNQDFVQTYLSEASNNIRTADPMLKGISRTTDGGLDPRPSVGSPALLGAMDIDDDFFVKTSYVGAFGGDNWLQNWTALDQLGYLTPQSAGSGAERTIVDTDIPVGSHVTFSSDTTYILSGMVFVDSAAVLTIEPGTIIKAEDGQGNQASGLVVTRYAKIYAEGTADRPIIFTSVNDELNGNLTHEDRGLWGGVILLGQASTNNQTANGLKAVEGVNEIVPAGDTRPYYGGTNDTHSSGVFKYVSIRYTGINVGDQAGNEIQGLTLGGVGSGTIIDHVESYASADDGFEWFGGTVNAKYLVSAFAADDGFDYDEGFRGKGQFWFAIQAPDQGGRIMEMDGATGDEFYSPYAIPILANMTLIGAGIGATPEGDGEQALIWRDNAGCKFYNNVITDYDDASTGLALTIEDVDNTGSKTEDSRKRLEEGDLVIMNNLFYGFGAGNTINEMSNQDFVQTYLAEASNNIRTADPMLAGISRTTDGGLDPRPGTGSPALSGAMTIDDNFFTPTSYVGAFGSENWLANWTALDDLGYIGDLVAIESDANENLPVNYSLSQNYPNPFNPTTKIQFSLPESAHVQVNIYNILGQLVTALVDQEMSAGNYTVDFNAENLSSGIYFYTMKAGSQAFAKKMTLLK